MNNQYKLPSGFNMESICEMAIYTHGRKHQHVKAIEELGELVQALARSIISGGHNVEEETADVEIMIFQLKKFFKSRDLRGTKRPTIHGPLGISLIIKDLSYLITELSRAINSEDHRVGHAIYKVDEALLHIREIYYADRIEQFKYIKLTRLLNNILKMHKGE